MKTTTMPQTEQDNSVDQSVTLRPATLIALSLVILCAVALAYVGGVMSGRSAAEKEYFQEIEKFTHKDTAQVQEQNTDTSGIIQAEDLEFSRVLRNDNMLPSKKMKPVPPPKPEQQANTQLQSKKNSFEAPQQNLDSTSGSDKPLFDYIYQVAAVKNDDFADALRQRLEGRGLRTFMKRSGNLLLIQVKLRGDHARSKELLQILENMRLGRPILISQKPAKN